MIWDGEHSEAAPAPPSERSMQQIDSETVDPKTTCSSDIKKKINAMLVESLDEFRTFINNDIKKLPVAVAQAEGRENMKKFIDTTKGRIKEVSGKIFDEKSEALYNILVDKPAEEADEALRIFEAIYAQGFMNFSHLMIDVLFRGLSPVFEMSQEIARKCDVMVGEVNAVYEKGSSGHDH